jgi:hypothetical protein
MGLANVLKKASPPPKQSAVSLSALIESNVSKNSAAKLIPNLPDGLGAINVGLARSRRAG